jgi:arginine decarboxylase
MTLTEPLDGHPLEITVRTATGSGRTLLAAFDDALLSAGVANFNLITLSSVIPPHSTVRTGVTGPLAQGGHGDRLYCVMAVGYADHPGEMVTAGLGWAINHASGGGLFVEHCGGNEQSVIEQIQLSLEDMSRNRGGGYDSVEHAVVTSHCDDKPVCALAIATYQVIPWGVDV